MERVSNPPNEGPVQVIPGDPQPGDWVRQGGDYFRYYPITPATPQPKPLSKTAFMDHAITQLGSIAAFQTLMEACRDSTDQDYGATLRYAYSRYDAADVLNKTVVATLSQVMVDAGLLSASDRTAVLDNWP